MIEIRLLEGRFSFFVCQAAPSIVRPRFIENIDSKNQKSPKVSMGSAKSIWAALLPSLPFPFTPTAPMPKSNWKVVQSTFLYPMLIKVYMGNKKVAHIRYAFSDIHVGGVQDGLAPCRLSFVCKKLLTLMSIKAGCRTTLYTMEWSFFGCNEVY